MILFYDSRCDMVTGAQRSMLTLVDACVKRGEAVSIATVAEGPLLERARSLGLPAVNLHLHSGDGGRFRSPAGLLRLPFAILRVLWHSLSMLRRMRPALVYLNSPAGSLFLGVWARMLGIPVIWYVRLDRRQRLFFWLAGLVATRILLVSADVKKAFLSGELRRWERKMEVLHTGFPAPERRSATQAELERELANEQGVELPDVHPRFLLLATYDPRKGHADALMAFATYVHAGGVGVLVFCGHASDDEAHVRELKASAEALGVRDAVQFLSETRLPRALIRVCDTIILPSRSEGLPRVIVEALAEGREVIAYPVSGARELIRDENCGVVLARPEPELLAMAMRERVDAGMAARFADEREAAVAHLTVERYTDRFLAICDDLRTGR